MLIITVHKYCKFELCAESIMFFESILDLYLSYLRMNWM